MAALLVLATICRRPVTLTFDLLTLKSVWESHVTWGTPVESFVFLGLLVFKLEPMYATSDGRTPITALCPLGGGITNEQELLESANSTMAKMIRDSNRNFRLNLDLDPDVCRCRVLSTALIHSVKPELTE